jgi:pullulanase
MNNWGVTHLMRLLDPTHLAAELDLPAGEHEFKVASSDFQSLDLGARSGQDAVQPARTAPTQAGGMNFRLKTNTASHWRFTLDFTDELHPLLLVLPL